MGEKVIQEIFGARKKKTIEGIGEGKEEGRGKEGGGKEGEGMSLLLVFFVFYFTINFE